MHILKTMVLTGLLVGFSDVQAEPMGTAFTYQGELAQQNTPATGTYDFQFELFDVQTDGTSVSSNIQLEDVSVQDGVFTVELDFGSEVFDGTQLWLGIAVREGASVNAYTTLNPRQKLTASPYATFAQASTGDNCTAITSLPYTISSAGVYCFTGNLETSVTTGNAITIEADNVVIDLNGWMLDGLDAGASTVTMGISGSELTNTTIRNGTIRGFYRGIRLTGVDPYTDSGGHLIEGVRVDKNLNVGFFIQGSGNIVRRNEVINTGGSTLQASVGISSFGPAARVLDNDIISTRGGATLRAYGIYMAYADGAVVENNRVHEVYNSFPTGTSEGIRCYNSSGVLIVGNRITHADEGIRYSTLTDGCTGKYMDNLTGNVGTEFIGGTAVGTNN